MILEYLRVIVRDNVYCEDNKLRIKNKLKYDIVNLVSVVDKDWFNELKKELEYSE